MSTDMAIHLSRGTYTWANGRFCVADYCQGKRVKVYRLQNRGSGLEVGVEGGPRLESAN